MQELTVEMILECVRKELNQLEEKYRQSKAPKKEWEVWLTEDGVEVPIIEGNQLFYVSGFDFKMSYFTFTDLVDAKGIRGKFPEFKYFSTQEAAEKWVADNRPLLSLKDVKEVLDQWDFKRGTDEDILSDLTALVKQKLNASK